MGASHRPDPFVAREPIEARLERAGLPPLPRTAWLEIDLDALRANLHALREAVGPDVRVEPVVKADAYGHGAVPVARALETAGADGLSVATLDEAFELREAGITLPILVIYPVPPAGVEAAAWARIAVAVSGGVQLSRTLAVAAAAAADGAPPLDVHLEIETGLGRGGVLPEAALETVATLLGAPGVRLSGVWSHLAAADDSGSAVDQDTRFGATLGRLATDARLGTHPDGIRRHIAGSGGVLGADVHRWDAVRTGISLYGLVPDALTLPRATADVGSRLRPVMALLARPVRVEWLPAGHGVSYGPSFVTTRPTRIATLPVGYADGWRRAFSDRAAALVRGVRVPLVGRVAMDAVMADVTDVGGPPVTEDDEFVLLGRQGAETITAHDLAATGETISYEVLTGMSRRLPRVYHAAGSPVETRALAGWRSEWRASSSGTATSATSRSTRS
jgi:alanine racemase